MFTVPITRVVDRWGTRMFSAVSEKSTFLLKKKTGGNVEKLSFNEESSKVGSRYWLMSLMTFLYLSWNFFIFYNIESNAFQVPVKNNTWSINKTKIVINKFTFRLVQQTLFIDIFPHYSNLYGTVYFKSI